MIPWWFTEIGKKEKASLVSAFEARCFSMGPIVAELEMKISQMLDVPYVVVTNSGTSALTIALLTVGVRAGDEVIMPAVSWIATAQSAAILGAKAILVDVLPDAPIIDASKVAAKISRKTKVILPVHLNGRECDLKSLKEIAHNEGAYLIEDTCKAMCSKNRNGYLGTIGDVGCFSMGMISLLSVGYGGFLVTRSEEIYNKARLIRDHGVVRHPEAYQYLGGNFKISDLLAALGMSQLARIKEKIGHTCKIQRRYEQGLSSLENISVFPVDIAGGKVPLYTEIYSKYRDNIYEFLAKKGMGSAKYHLPMYEAEYLGAEGEFQNAKRLAKNGLFLASGPSQPMENVERCIELLYEFDKKIA